MVILPESVSRAISLIEARKPVGENVLQPESSTTVTSQVGVQSTVAN